MGDVKRGGKGINWLHWEKLIVDKDKEGMVFQKYSWFKAGYVREARV